MTVEPRTWLAIAVAIGVVLGFASPSMAQNAQEGAQSQLGLKLSGDEPIQIESDKLEVNDKESLAIFSGNVSVVQGPTLLKAGKMTVYYAKGGGSAATGSANIDRIEVENKIYVKTDKQEATGDRGTFDMKSEILVLTGKEVVLSEGENVIVGCKLTADMKSGTAHLEGCGGGGDAGSGRVKVLLKPGSQQTTQ